MIILDLGWEYEYLHVAIEKQMSVLTYDTVSLEQTPLKWRKNVDHGAAYYKSPWLLSKSVVIIKNNCKI